ncbi:unnamed protein product, partial [Mesorhabditis spiculigera]
MAAEDVYVVVKYDYLAQEDQELTIKKNERLRLIDDTKNWWKVVNDTNRVGFVPSNYVRRESFVDKAMGTMKGLVRGRSKSDFSPEDAPAASSGEDRRILLSNNNQANGHNYNGAAPGFKSGTMSRAVVKYAYEPRMDDELALRKGETILVLERSSDGWWKGEANGETGWFPSNYVEEENESPATNGNGVSENARPQAARADTRPVLEVVLALYSFDASNHEELSFRKGEQLDIVGHPADDPEWWTARNASGACGLVPRNYIKVIQGGQAASSAPAPAPAPVAYNGQSANIPIANAGFNGHVPGGYQAAPPSPHSGDYSTEPWFFGRITREQAERALERGQEGDYLVRDSESKPGDLSISMKGVERFKHFKVTNTMGQLKIGQRTFNNMHDLIRHYTTHAIFSSDTEKLCLGRPAQR